MWTPEQVGLVRGRTRSEKPGTKRTEGTEMTKWVGQEWKGRRRPVRGKGKVSTWFSFSLSLELLAYMVFPYYHFEDLFGIL